VEFMSGGFESYCKVVILTRSELITLIKVLAPKPWTSFTKEAFK